MAVTILNGKTGTPNSAHPEVTVDQIEVFGRLRMTKHQIAEWYGLTIHQIRYLFKRTDLKKAYDRGKAEVSVAIKQKQIEMALGGSAQMLIHTGIHFADQSKDGVIPETEDHDPNRFSWEAELRERLADARTKITGEGS